MTGQRKILIGLGGSLALVALLVALLFLLLGRQDPGRRALDGDESGRVSGPAGEPGGESELAVDPSRDTAAEAPTEDADAAPPEGDERPPLLTGTVTGEGAPVEGARVLIYAVSGVEAFLRRLERFDPGAGLPDIPGLIATLKAELAQFRDGALVARSDAEGVYEFRDIPAVPHFMLTLADGWVFRYGDVVALIPDETTTLDLELDRGASIAGRVVDASDTGVPDVTVTAEYRPAGMQGVGRIVQKLLAYVNGEFLKGPFQARTDAEGRFVVDSLPPGAYDLLAEKSGFAETRLEAVATGTTEAVILLQPGVRVDGLVVDIGGLPIEGVEVRLTPEKRAVALPFPGVGDIIATVERILGERELVELSAKNGAVRFRNVEPGRYTLEAKPPGYLPVERMAEIPAGERVATLDSIRLDPGGVITGHVQTTGGAPLADATVTAFPEGMTFFSMGGAVNDMVTGRNSTATDSNGYFRLSGLATGSYNVFAQARGHGGDSQEKVLTGDEPLAFALEPGVTISGRVVDAATDEPMPGVRVSSSGVITTSDDEGLFTLEGVAPRDRGMDPFRNMGGPGGRGRRGRGGQAGDEATEAASTRSSRLEVRAHTPGYQDATETIEKERAHEELVIEMELKPVVTGVALSPEGEPLPGTLVRLVPGNPADNPFLAEGAIFLDVSVAKLEGDFRLDAPTDGGTFTVMASHPLYATTSSETFRPRDLDPEKPLEVRLSEGGIVRGLVSDGVAPIAGARVRLARAREEDPRAAIFMNMLGLPKEGKVAYSSSTGEFDYGSMLPGEYVLTAEVAGFGDTRTERFSLAVGETKEMRIVMDRGGEIAGVVTAQDEAPLGGVRVRVLKESGADERMMAAQRFLGGAFKTSRTGEDGTFVVSGLPAGRYTVVAEKTGFSRAEVVGVEPDDLTPTRLVLVAASELEGRVVDVATGLPVQRYELRIAPTEASANVPREFQFRPWQEISDGDGRFFRNNLEAGTYEVNVRAKGFAPAEQRVVLPPGERRAMSIALAQAGILIGTVLDAETGQPVTGASIGLARPSRATAEVDAADARQSVQRFFEDVSLGQWVSSADDGSFTLEGFPAEPQVVVISHDDYVQEHRRDIEIPLGESMELEVRLRKGRTVAGRVIGADGEPGAGFLLIEGRSESTSGVRKGVSVNPTGEFRVGGLEPGAYRLILTGRERRGAPPTILDIEVGDQDLLDLVMQ